MPDNIRSKKIQRVGEAVRRERRAFFFGKKFGKLFKNPVTILWLKRSFVNNRLGLVIFMEGGKNPIRCPRDFRPERGDGPPLFTTIPVSKPIIRKKETP
jgi:hypothetical protein